jgi:ABC-type bacteriocin/lantibiotic exporter with double-glycine peptidase domain
MPSPNPVSHVQQLALGYCLPACAEMVMAQFGLQANQKELGLLLTTRAGVGTPFSRINLLEKFHLQVQIVEWAGEESLQLALSENKAVIVAILTSPGLPGWNTIESQHSVLLLAMDDNSVTYHDPALTYGPVTASLGEFLLAWSEMAEQVAFISQQ